MSNLSNPAVSNPVPATSSISTAPTAPETVALSQYTVAALSEVLGMCEEFLRTAGPTVHAELRGYLACQYPPADPVWLIDTLGVHALHLRHQLPPTAPSPRENHQPHGDPVDPVDPVDPACSAGVAR